MTLAARLVRNPVSAGAVVGGIVLTGAAAAAVVWFPPAIAVVLFLAVVAVFPRQLNKFALALLLAGPILGSEFTVGALTLDNWIVLGGLAFTIVWALRERRLPFSSPSLYPLLFGLAILLSGVVDGIDSLPGVVRALGVAVLPGLLVGRGGLGTQAASRIMITVVMLGALSVIAQPITHYLPGYQDGDRYGGLFGHPNFAACSMSLTMLYLIAMRGPRLWRYLGVILLAGAVMLTGSLGAVAALLVGIVVLLIRSLPTMVVIAVGIAGVATIAGATLFDRVDALTLGSGTDSLVWRFGQWQSAIALTTPPNLFGIGWQQTEVELPNALPAHSAYVETYVELGVVGCVLVAIGFIVMALRARREILTLAILSYVLIASLTDPILFYPSTLALMMTILGIRRGASESVSPVLFAMTAARRA